MEVKLKDNTLSLTSIFQHYSVKQEARGTQLQHSGTKSSD